MIEVSGIPLSLDAMLPEKRALQEKEVARALGISPAELEECVLLRRSVDAAEKRPKSTLRLPFPVNFRKIWNCVCLRRHQRVFR